jgi:hypothetical protein
VDQHDSLVSQMARAHGHGVKHLEELGTRPNVSYFKGG